MRKGVSGKSTGVKSSAKKSPTAEKTKAAKQAATKKAVTAKKGRRASAKSAGSATRGSKNAAAGASKRKKTTAKGPAAGKKKISTKKAVPAKNATTSKKGSKAVTKSAAAKTSARSVETPKTRSSAAKPSGAKKGLKPATKWREAPGKRAGSPAKSSRSGVTKESPKRTAKSAKNGGAATQMFSKKHTGGSTAHGAATKRLPAAGTHRAPESKVPFAAYKGSRPYIFVSYSHRNILEVFAIIKKLNDSRYRLWYDEGIEPGYEWPEVVGKALLGSSQLLVFMSRAAAVSRNVRNEVNLAFSEGKNIMVIYLEKTSLTEGMKLQIGAVQFLNRFEMSDREFIDKLKSVLSNDLHN